MTEPERGIDGRTRAVTFPHSSLENYRQVAEAYLGALEEHLADGRDISRIASVASLFVSRVDAPVDTLLQDRIKAAGTGAKSQLKDLEGKAAIAMPAWPTRSSNGCLVGHALHRSGSPTRGSRDNCKRRVYKIHRLLPETVWLY